MDIEMDLDTGIANVNGFVASKPSLKNKSHKSRKNPSFPSASDLSTSSSSAAALTLHRCRFPDWTPTHITAVTLTPPSFDAGLLGFGGHSAERGVLGVGRASGDVQLSVWGGEQGWAAWRTLPSSFAPPASPRNNTTPSTKKPTSLLSHLLFTHQTTLSPADADLYADDLDGATKEVKRLEREGVRLFGVGGVGSELVEWEWGGPGSSSEVGRVKSNLPTLPPIFALAANRSSSHLAVACEDSTIRILNILDDALELVSKIEVGGPGKVRALSLAWGLPVLPVKKGDKAGEETESSDGEVPLPAHFLTPMSPTLLAGCSNSTLTLYSQSTTATSNASTVGTWRATQRMTVDKNPSEPTVIWAVAVLAPSSPSSPPTLVSADSMGNVKFWDGLTGTQRQSFRASKADLLSIAVGPTGKTLFVSGIEQKTTEFQLAPIGKTPRWVLSSSRRLHAHDVRSLVISPPYVLPVPSPAPASSAATTPIIPILTSGGLDLSLIIVPVSAPSTIYPAGVRNPVSSVESTEFETTTHRKCSYVPQRDRVASVAGSGVLVVRRARSVGLWTLGGKDGWRKDLDMDLKLQTNLVASAISADGKWLAISDLYETKLFRLSSKSGVTVPRRQKTFSTALSDSLPPSLGTGSQSLVFTPDSGRLVLSTAFGGVVAVVELPKEREEEFDVTVLGGSGRVGKGGRQVKGLKVNGMTNGKGGESTESEEDSDEDDEMEGVEAQEERGKPAANKSVVCFAVSADGKWLASADLARKVSVFDLSTLSHYTTLPTPDTVPAAMIFVPSASPSLLLISPSNAISQYSLMSRKFLPFPSKTSLLSLREPCLGVSFEPQPVLAASAESQGKVHASRRVAQQTTNHIAVLWGSNWVARIDMDKLPVSASSSSGGVQGKRARAASHSSTAPRNGKVFTKGHNGENVFEVKVMRKYQPLVLFDFVRQGEVVAVEKVWSDLAKEAPEAFIKNGEFGT